MREETEKNCPCCENHCAADALKCRRGAEYFGSAGGEGKRARNISARREERAEEHGRRIPRERENAATADKAVEMILKCGHYLHHGSDVADSEALTACLSEEEKRALIELLEKCLRLWTKE